MSKKRIWDFLIRIPEVFFNEPFSELFFELLWVCLGSNFDIRPRFDIWINEGFLALVT